MSRVHQVSWGTSLLYLSSKSDLHSSYWDALFCGISVIFVDKDGEEKHIKVPIGMSMLEAAHENDIELEGKDSDAYLVQSFAPLPNFVFL